ncbi:hypothetical protein B0H13DRAFT_1878694 [Mycena leptocephala]|nr:hypothetical protein B0H13DRAFT_1878694 [Mycena leptocephala]
MQPRFDSQPAVEASKICKLAANWTTHRKQKWNNCGTLAELDISDTHTYFSYNERHLWLVYGLGLGCALLADLVGVFALVRNQFGATAGFTDFLAATRNTELNELDFTGAKQKQRIRLRYGPLRDATGRYAFAFPESICVPTEGAERRASAVSTTTADQGESHQMKPLMYLSHAE